MDLFESLQDEHRQLVGLLDANTAPVQLIPMVERFIGETKIKSEQVSDLNERNQMRTLLRFWAGYIYEQKGVYPDTTLRPSIVREEENPPAVLEEPGRPSKRLAQLREELFLALKSQPSLARFLALLLAAIGIVTIWIAIIYVPRISTQGPFSILFPGRTPLHTPTETPTAPTVILTPILTDTPTPDAQGCVYYHTIQEGESLSTISSYYGLSWMALARTNRLPPPYYNIYKGQTLCIPGGPNVTTISPTDRTWNFVVKSVIANVSVTIQSYQMPANRFLKVKIGRNVNGGSDWLNLPDLDTGDGGSFIAEFPIPVKFSGAEQLVLRLIENRTNGKTYSVNQIFTNVSPTPGNTIPSIQIRGVVKDSSVTVQLRNFPVNTACDALIGPEETNGKAGYYIGTVAIKDSGPLTATFSIPPGLYGLEKMAIRFEDAKSGFFAYEWFYNNTSH